MSADSAMKVAEKQFKYREQVMRTENAAYLVKNAKNKNVKVTASGLQYKVLKQALAPLPPTPQRLRFTMKANSSTALSSILHTHATSLPPSAPTKSSKAGLRL